MYRYAWKELLRHGTRTAGNVLGYALAVAFLVVALSIGQSHAKATKKELDIPGTKFIVYIPASEQSAFQDGGPCTDSVYTTMMEESCLAKIRQIPGVTGVAPYILFRKLDKGVSVGRSIAGLDLEHIGIWESFCAPNHVLSGRFLMPEDTDAVLLEEPFAQATGLKVNDKLDAFGRQFQVAGVVNTGIRPARPDMYAPLKVVQRIVHESDKRFAGDMNIMLVRVADPGVQNGVMKKVRELFPDAALASYKCYLPALTGTQITMRLVWVVSLVIAFFVTLYAAKSQLSSVIERTADIGILKAVGWPSSYVMRQILAESMIQAVAGGAVGCLVAILALLILRWDRYYGGNVTISAGIIALGMILALAGGVLAGLVPAWRAYRLRPAEALRRL